MCCKEVVGDVCIDSEQSDWTEPKINQTCAGSSTGTVETLALSSNPMLAPVLLNSYSEQISAPAALIPSLEVISELLGDERDPSRLLNALDVYSHWKEQMECPPDPSCEYLSQRDCHCQLYLQTQ
jgi:hypothetical protein